MCTENTLKDCVCVAHPLIVVRQRKPFRRKDGLVIYFEDNAGVIVNPKGDLKGAFELFGVELHLWILRSWPTGGGKVLHRIQSAQFSPYMVIECTLSHLLLKMNQMILLQALLLLDQSQRSVQKSGHVLHLQQTALFKQDSLWQRANAALSITWYCVAFGNLHDLVAEGESL
jgi:hypothetical protein